MRRQFVQKMPRTRQRVGVAQPLWALEFNGSSDYFSVADSAELRLGTDDFTFSFWEKPDSTGSANNNNVRIDKGGVSGSGSIYLYQNNGYRLRINGSDVFDGLSSIIFNEWNHIAIVRDGNNILFYRNGAELGSWSGWGSVNINATANLFFGSAGGSTRFYKGQLDDIRMWNKALSESEIQGSMTDSLTGSETDLAAYWPMNEGSGNTVYDESASNNDGTIVGATWVKRE